MDSYFPFVQGVADLLYHWPTRFCLPWLSKRFMIEPLEGHDTNRYLGHRGRTFASAGGFVMRQVAKDPSHLTGHFAKRLPFQWPLTSGRK